MVSAATAEAGGVVVDYKSMLLVDESVGVCCYRCYLLVTGVIVCVVDSGGGRSAGVGCD